MGAGEGKVTTTFVGGPWAQGKCTDMATGLDRDILKAHVDIWS